MNPRSLRAPLIWAGALLASLSACSVGTSVVGGADGSVDVVNDLGGLDVPSTPDVPTPPADTGPTTCARSADCVGNPMGSVCDVNSGRCVRCTATEDTCPADQYCLAGACQPGCHTDDGCPRAAAEDGGAGAQLHCNTMTRTCQECITDDHCPVGMLCSGNICVLGCSASRACPTGQSCCGGACADLQSNEANCGACSTACTTAHGEPACMAGMCAVGRCTAPYADCDHTAANGCETDVTADLMNCGSCGRACVDRPHAASSCAAGVCQFTCAAGFADCNMNPDDGCEVELATNPRNCGTCGNGCTSANATPTCVAGACAMGACDMGFGDCDMDPSNGCEVALATSVDHCGTCGAACSRAGATPTCAAGACAVTCAEGFGDCDMSAANGCETDLRTSAGNCGRCGAACSAAGGTASCTAGACGIACAAGRGDCDSDVTNGCETDTNTSSASCGRCGAACSPTNGAGACVAGACTVTACNDGFADCDMSAANGCETNLRTDVANCGRCGAVCTSPSGTPVCRAGVCGVGSCPSGTDDCDRSPTNGCEVNLTTDVNNCSACGTRCATPANGSAGCAGSACTIASCNAGFGNCDGNTTNGCETSTATSVANCGSCGNACPARANATSTCSAGTCGFTCSTGFGDCDGNAANGCETDLRVTVGRCGSCSNVCATPSNGAPGCSGGVCTVASCNAGFGNCDGNAANGCETATSSSTSNCGSCGVVCGSGFVCSSGSCQCPAGQTNCSGVCRTLTSDASNCGSCGVVCGAGQSCSGGSCVCPAGQTSCSGVCRDLQNDMNNCGSCGTVCGAGTTCASGRCVGTGQLRFTLSWTLAGDMDFHVVPPCGTEIYYANRTACGGTLDVDDTSTTGPENIFWTSGAASGTYIICVVPYRISGTTNFTATVNVSGSLVRTFTGSRTTSSGNVACSTSSPYYIGSFTL